MATKKKTPAPRSASKTASVKSPGAKSGSVNSGSKAKPSASKTTKKAAAPSKSSASKAPSKLKSPATKGSGTSSAKASAKGGKTSTSKSVANAPKKATPEKTAAKKPAKSSGSPKATDKSKSSAKTPVKKTPAKKAPAKKAPAAKSRPKSAPLKAEKKKTAPKPEAASPVSASKKTAPSRPKKETPPQTPPAHIKRSIQLAPAVLVTGGHAEKKTCGKPADVKYRKLTKKELAAVEETLKRMREDILHGLRKEISDARSRSTGMLADPVDQATETYDDDISFEIASTSEDELEQIQIALEKIEKGTYGLCEECEAPISPSRLRILPYATACVTCRGVKETERKRENNQNWIFIANEPETEDES